MSYGIESDGFTILTSVYSERETDRLWEAIESAFAQDDSGAGLQTSHQNVFAGRNLIDLMPEITTCWRTDRLIAFLSTQLGDQFGLVRALYFDKPSHRSWTLPWHKDMTIAVKDNRLGGTHFCKPTMKAGIGHVEASDEILGRMLTLRIHLDTVTKENGPLEVIPGSHLSGKVVAQSKRQPLPILVAKGDVLAMRPLLSHASGNTNPDGELRRRILHLEFCGQRHLPDGYEWRWFAT